jgi:hypothetical protein
MFGHHLVVIIENWTKQLGFLMALQKMDRKSNGLYSYEPTT